MSKCFPFPHDARTTLLCFRGANIFRYCSQIQFSILFSFDIILICLTLDPKSHLRDNWTAEGISKQESVKLIGPYFLLDISGNDLGVKVFYYPLKTIYRIALHQLYQICLCPLLRPESDSKLYNEYNEMKSMKSLWIL